MHNNSRSIGALKTYDARTKLYILTAYLLMSFLGWKIIPIIIFLLSGIGIVFLSRIRINILWDMSKSAILIELVISLLCLTFLKPLMVVFIAVKLIMITLVYNSIMSCMKQVDVLDGLMIGFRLKIDATKRFYNILEYFPEVYSQKKRVRSALKARGVDPDSGNLIRRFVKETTLAVPNHRNAFVELSNRNRAMDMRSFTSARRRKRIYEMKLEVVDDIMLMLAVILIIGTVFTQVYFK